MLFCNALLALSAVNTCHRQHSLPQTLGNPCILCSCFYIYQVNTCLPHSIAHTPLSATQGGLTSAVTLIVNVGVSILESQSLFVNESYWALWPTCLLALPLILSTCHYVILPLQSFHGFLNSSGYWDHIIYILGTCL